MSLIYITELIHDDGLDRLTEAGHQVVKGWEGRPCPETAEAMIIRTNPLDADAIGRLPELRVISKHGVGCDNIDHVAASACNIPITITPGANAGSVAEHTLAMIFASARRFGPLDRGLRSGDWPRGGNGIMDIAGKRLLIVGYGAVGQRVAKIASALQLDVRVFAPGHTLGKAHGQVATLEEGMTGANILSLHLPLTAETRGMIDEDQLRLLSPGALVINTARGGIVDEAALARLCAADHIGGIGFDVFGEEPITKNSPLLSVENAILTPHAAAMSDGAKRAMAVMAAQNVLDAFAGKINPAVLFRA